jgi:hypothetical protein
MDADGDTLRRSCTLVLKTIWKRHRDLVPPRNAFYGRPGEVGLTLWNEVRVVQGLDVRVYLPSVDSAAGDALN